jgi:sodium-dependent dicarboxylate transporter 2/3/5
MMIGAATLWIALWWLSEASSIYLTALLPLLLFPLSGALDIQSTAAPYGSWLVWLLFCGFVLASAIEKWNLHRRIALRIILATGTAPRRIVLGFMLATGFLSMWISNTATSVMMVPIGIAVAKTLSGRPGGDDDDFGRAIMLCIAYSASIGGMATLIGTPTNLIFASAVNDIFNIEITFQQWLLVGLPTSGVLLTGAWLYLTRMAFQFPNEDEGKGRKEIMKRYRELGPISTAELRVAIVFGLVAFAWISRSFLLKQFIPLVNDTSIGLFGVLALFMLPSGERAADGQSIQLLDWPTVQRIPWGVMILIGGGLAIAAGFSATDLAAWTGTKLEVLQFLPLFLLLLFLVAAVNFMTEVTSNMATASIMMPILAVMAEAVGVSPLVLMASATLAAGCAFMLPVATPPNAVVFGAGYLRIGDMVRVGFRMNLFSILVIVLLALFWLPLWL